MADNGNGTFNRNYNFVQDRLNNQKPAAERFDGEFDNFKAGLDNRICRDGQTTIIADMPFNNKKITSLGDASLDTDALNRRTADARYVQPSADVITNKLPLTGGTISGDLTVSKASPALSLLFPGVKASQWIIDGGGTMILRDTNSGQNHLYITSSGAVWTQQFGDLNNRIEDRAYSWAMNGRDQAINSANNQYNSAISTANDRVHRVQMAGYGEIGGTDGGMSNCAPGVFTGARGTPYGAQTFAYRILQMHIPSQGGWVNIWVS